MSFFYDEETNQYLNRISQFEILSKEKINSLIQEYRQGNTMVKDDIIKSHLLLVVSIAKKYSPYLRHLQFLDIVQEGNLGLIRAIETYDESKSSFVTYASLWIEDKIYRAICNTNNEIRRPIYLCDIEKKYHKILSDSTLLHNEIPDDDELCQRLGMSKNLLKSIQSQNQVVSMNAPLSSLDDQEFGDFISDSKFFSQDLISEIDTKNFLLVLKSVLSFSDYYIFYYYLIVQNCTLEDLGKKFMISFERIRQRTVFIRETAQRYYTPSLYQKCMTRLQDTYGKYFHQLNVKPILLDDVLRYEYIRPYLNDMERQLYRLKFVERHSFCSSYFLHLFHLEKDEFKTVYQNFLETVRNRFSNSQDYKAFKKEMISIFHTSISTFLKDPPVFYGKIWTLYMSKSYLEIQNYFQGEWHILSLEDEMLLQRFYQEYDEPTEECFSLEMRFNQCLFFQHLDKKKIAFDCLFPIYQENIFSFSIAQQDFIESFVFQKKGLDSSCDSEFILHTLHSFERFLYSKGFYSYCDLSRVCVNKIRKLIQNYNVPDSLLKFILPMFHLRGRDILKEHELKRVFLLFHELDKEREKCLSFTRKK